MSQEMTKTDSRISTIGKILLGLTGGVAVGLSIICIPFVSPALRKYCLPFIPATKAQIENITKALTGRGGTLLDIGSGDGRIVFELAKHNFEAHGVELNYFLVLYSKLQAFERGLHDKTKFYRRDLWKFPFENYDNIVIFGVEQMMGALERKFESECKPGCCVVACRFPLPNRTPDASIGQGIDTVWLYSFT